MPRIAQAFFFFVNVVEERSGFVIVLEEEWRAGDCENFGFRLHTGFVTLPFL